MSQNSVLDHSGGQDMFGADQSHSLLGGAHVVMHRGESGDDSNVTQIRPRNLDYYQQEFHKGEEPSMIFNGGERHESSYGEEESSQGED